MPKTRLPLMPGANEMKNRSTGSATGSFERVLAPIGQLWKRPRTAEPIEEEVPDGAVYLVEIACEDTELRERLGGIAPGRQGILPHMPNLTSAPTDNAPAPSEQRPATRKRKRARASVKPAPSRPVRVDDVVPPQPWPEFIRTAALEEIEKRFKAEAQKIVADDTAISGRYLCLAIMQPVDSLSGFQLDQVFNSLVEFKADGGDKDVLLLLLSPGGSIEPAYQISKLCRSMTQDKFVVCIPRQAKSAATLLALGADEIHMGFLGHLGPIDPQLGGLPALGVSQALETLAMLVERHPKSADMFAHYLQTVVSIEQIGYYDRICASAIQYAERLLSTKKRLPKPATDIARELVYEYKDHGFVIDVAEAQEHLGAEWVKTHTPETFFGERLYRHYEMVNLFLNVYRQKKLWVCGSLAQCVFIVDQPSTSRRGT